MKRVLSLLFVITVALLVYFSPHFLEDNITIVSVKNKTAGGLGTGFFIDEKNILTVAHVVDLEDGPPVISDMEILDEAMHRHPVRVVGIDTDTDIAVLNLVGESDIKPKLPCSRHIVGDDFKYRDDIISREVFYSKKYGYSWMSTFIEPYIYPYSIYKKGEILGPDWNLGAPALSYIMHDSAIIPGYSGSPLLDSNDCYLGINASRERVRSKISSAVSLMTIEQVLPDLLKSGKVDMPFLGIILQQSLERVFISGAITNSPADILSDYDVKMLKDFPKDLMKFEDVIIAETYPTHELIAINGQKVNSLYKAWDILRALPSGSPITLIMKDPLGNIDIIKINSGERFSMIRKYIPHARYPLNSRLLVV